MEQKRSIGRNIGGSLLPSGGPDVCKPQKFGDMTLQVVASEELDTHFLLIEHKDGTSILAQHPNGHSCKALADRMIQGDSGRVEGQRVYIESCGGMVRPARSFQYYLEQAKEQNG